MFQSSAVEMKWILFSLIVRLPFYFSAFFIHFSYKASATVVKSMWNTKCERCHLWISPIKLWCVFCSLAENLLQRRQTVAVKNKALKVLSWCSDLGRQLLQTHTIIQMETDKCVAHQRFYFMDWQQQQCEWKQGIKLYKNWNAKFIRQFIQKRAFRQNMIAHTNNDDAVYFISRKIVLDVFFRRLFCSFFFIFFECMHGNVYAFVCEAHSFRSRHAAIEYFSRRRLNCSFFSNSFFCELDF